MLRASITVLLLSIGSAVTLAGPLHDVVRAGDVEQVRALVEAGANLDEKDANGETPLNLAIVGDNATLALLLIDRGAEIQARNEGGFTPLHAAAYSNAVAIAERLIDMGADLNDRTNKAGVSPLNVASEESHADVVKLLIERDADLEAGDRNGYTALTRALWRGHENVASVLQAAGAKCQPVEILEEPIYSQCMEGQL
jgi:ankyrin repeat protein